MSYSSNTCTNKNEKPRSRSKLPFRTFKASSLANRARNMSLLCRPTGRLHVSEVPSAARHVGSLAGVVTCRTGRDALALQSRRQTWRQTWRRRGLLGGWGSIDRDFRSIPDDLQTSPVVWAAGYGVPSQVFGSLGRV